MASKTTDSSRRKGATRRRGQAGDESPAAVAVVAVGASAGGIEAFTRLLKALPNDTGMAFVMILHLSPDHESMLADILGRASSMPVANATDGATLDPNHIYVLPPGCELSIAAGRLRLEQRRAGYGQARPIDHFMRSLAESQGHKSIGIVLSGTATDGTLGLEEIKAAGGITFAQDETALQDGMPRSAIASGIVDFVLSPEDMARELRRISSHPYVARVDVEPPGGKKADLAVVLEILREATGVDFSSYKSKTLNRRIARRMLLHNRPDLDGYVKLLRTDRDEVEALYQDVLINVTSFFRDPEAFEALKRIVFPRITEGRDRETPVRAWVLGCSTGEEAYSIAMAYSEYADASGRRVPLQLFATDVNGLGIEKARSGTYARSIEQDVSPERLRRFFAQVDGRYRVAESIREMCVFARQNALSDPPFSRIDLVACRNMLIYLEPALQQRLIPTLHFALQPKGFLWLGGSETIGSYDELFEVCDEKHRIYRRKGASAGAAVLPMSRPASRPASRPGSFAPAAQGGPVDVLREVDLALLSRYAPPGVLVDEALNIVQFRGDTSPYLAPPQGRATLNLLKMLREGLLVEVRGALSKAGREKTAVRSEGLRVRTQAGWREVDVMVIPLRRGLSAEAGYLVLFEEPAERMRARARIMSDEMRVAAESVPASRDESSVQEISRLSNELSATREYLQSLVEQQEAQNEELQSANEEIQSANEELQSINEELETSKEELQSANEELATVNDELRNRNSELSQSTNDLTNLLASVNMAIVMVGPDLSIRRFTQPAEKILNLIKADVGRPLRDIRFGIDVPDLDAMVTNVIETVTTREREVQDRNGRWYSLRVRPYRTLNNRIDGVVLVLVDIDNLKRAGQSIRESEKRFETLADNAPVLIWVDDPEGCRFVNRAFEEFTGESEAQIREHGHAAFVHADDREAFRDVYAKAREAGERFEMRVRFRRADGAYRWMKVLGVPRFVEQGKVAGYVGCTFDITDMAEAEAALRELDRGKNEFLAILAHELRNPLSGVRNASRLLDDPTDKKALKQAREIIDRQTKHMVRMIDDLLDISRITYGKIQLRVEPVDIAAVLRRVVESGERQRADNDQKLELTIGEEPIYVSGDPVRLEQIFANLLANSSKFTRKGGRMWVSAEKDGSGANQSAVIRVRDNGVGIEAAMLPRVFELFAQGATPTEQARTGIGLGLTLAKRLVDLHGGTIEAHSAGHALGSEFVVRIPLITLPPRQTHSHKGERFAAVNEARRVMIVDDNEDSGGSLKLLLARAGHDVRLIEEGSSALEAAAQFKPDLVVLDIGLPDVDGYSVARQLRGDPRTRDVFIVAVTGYGRDEDRAKSAEAGVDEHMTKPVDPDVLMQRLREGRAATKSK